LSPPPAGYFSDRDDIGNDISNEKPSFECGWPGPAGSLAGEGLSAAREDRVRAVIGSFVKAGASQAMRSSEAVGVAFFGRISDLHTTSLASMRSGPRWQEQAQTRRM
jgi:hypothetical protein